MGNYSGSLATEPQPTFLHISRAQMQEAHSEEWASYFILVANRGIEPRTRGFSRQITRLASIGLIRRIVTNFLPLRSTVEAQPNRLPNFCELSVASWPFCRTASMGCTEVHRPAADIPMAPWTCHFRNWPGSGGREIEALVIRMVASESCHPASVKCPHC
jgi:hypothetical protein